VQHRKVSRSLSSRRSRDGTMAQALSVSGLALKKPLRKTYMSTASSLQRRCERTAGSGYEMDPRLPSFSSAVQNVFVFLYGNTFEYYGGAEALRVDCQDKAGSSHTGLSQVHSESVPPFLFPCTSCSSPFNFILANSTCALWGLIMMAAFRAASFVSGASPLPRR
jgi:hypothetical protein